MVPGRDGEMEVVLQKCNYQEGFFFGAPIFGNLITNSRRA